MIYPNMVYKNGERGDYKVCNNSDELIEASKENYWPIRESSRNEVMEMIKPEEVKKETIVEKTVVKSMDLAEKFTKETGKKAFAFGKETKAFKAYKEKK